jgi:hypothetical protein
MRHCFCCLMCEENKEGRGRFIAENS